MPNQFGPTFVQQLAFPGPTTTYTPQVDQGVTTNITKTVTFANYWLIGKLVIGFVNLAMTGAGTAGQTVTVSQPVSAARTAGVIGVGSYVDASVATYPSQVIQASGSLMFFTRTDDTSDGVIGANPNFAVANTDAIRFFFMYESA